jgi:hypothetical protein
MRRLVAAMLTTLMPLAAAGQSLAGYPGQPPVAEELLAQPQAPASGAAPDAPAATPLWRGSDGRMLSLQSGQATPAEAGRDDALLGFRLTDASRVASSGLQYDLGPHLQAQVGFSERSWANSGMRVVGSEVGATYSGNGYSLGLSLGSSSVPNSSSVLPRLLPGTAPGLAGSLPLAGFDSSTQVNARGRLALDAKSGIDLGASVGRIHLLPGNLLGISSVDQKALSFGVDRGPVSGTLVGRVMEPGAGIPGGFSGERRWSSIDLGVTWRLPWQGELSFGAQNVWTSGPAANTPAGPEPNQSRTPYVQYHQDL